MTTGTAGVNYCPKSVWLPWESGRLVFYRFPCNKWTCDRCRRRKAAEAVDWLVSMAGDGPLYAAELQPTEATSAAQRIRQGKANRLRVGRPGGGALVVADAPLRAWSWAWSLAEVDQGDLLELVLARDVQRVDWSADWRPAKEVKPAPLFPDRVVDRIFCPDARVSEVRAALERSGMVEPVGRDAYRIVASETPQTVAETIRAILDDWRFHTFL